MIEDLFPKPAATGRPPVKPRDMVDAILWRLRTGSPWRVLPEEFGPWKTEYNHFDKWNSDGTVDEIKRRLLQRIVDDQGISTDLWCLGLHHQVGKPTPVPKNLLLPISPDHQSNHLIFADE
ncbi:MAG: transposase [Planctomyces sp.]